MMLNQRLGLAAITKTKLDEYVCQKLKTLILEKNHQNIHAYIPMKGEINIVPLLQWLLENHYNVATPKTLPKRKLENRKLVSLKNLEFGIMKTQHPVEPIIYHNPFDLIIVPGLAFDEQKYRLGYGGGYYDNFLITQPQAQKVGIFYPFQKVSKVPIEEHDIKLDIIFAGYETHA